MHYAGPKMERVSCTSLVAVCNVKRGNDNPLRAHGTTCNATTWVGPDYVVAWGIAIGGISAVFQLRSLCYPHLFDHSDTHMQFCS